MTSLLVVTAARVISFCFCYFRFKGHVWWGTTRARPYYSFVFHCLFVLILLPYSPRFKNAVFLMTINYLAFVLCDPYPCCGTLHRVCLNDWYINWLVDTFCKLSLWWFVVSWFTCSQPKSGKAYQVHKLLWNFMEKKHEPSNNSINTNGKKK